jgi:hypothetical protein
MPRPKLRRPSRPRLLPDRRSRGVRPAAQELYAVPAAADNAPRATLVGLGGTGSLAGAACDTDGRYMYATDVSLAMRGNGCLRPA